MPVRFAWAKQNLRKTKPVPLHHRCLSVFATGLLAEREGLTSNLLQQESPFRHGPGTVREDVVVDLLKIAI